MLPPLPVVSYLSVLYLNISQVRHEFYGKLAESSNHAVVVAMSYARNPNAITFSPAATATY
jgi:hypothetical protein